MSQGCQGCILVTWETAVIYTALRQQWLSHMGKHRILLAALSTNLCKSFHTGQQAPLHKPSTHSLQTASSELLSDRFWLCCACSWLLSTQQAWRKPSIFPALLKKILFKNKNLLTTLLHLLFFCSLQTPVQILIMVWVCQVSQTPRTFMPFTCWDNKGNAASFHCRKDHKKFSLPAAGNSLSPSCTTGELRFILNQITFHSALMGIAHRTQQVHLEANFTIRGGWCGVRPQGEV